MVAGSPPRTGNTSFHKTLIQGLFGVTVLYLCLFVWLWSQASTTLRSIEDRLAFTTVTVERPPEGYVYPPAPPVIKTPVAKHETPPAPVEEQQETPHPSATGALPVAPLEGLYESSANGKLPIISKEGYKPFDAYKRPYTDTGKLAIAIAVLDYGLSSEDSKAAVEKLPPEVTMVLSPYAEDPDMWQKLAREHGHEIWLHLPVENQHFLSRDPGPLALLSQASIIENQKNLNAVLGRATGYAGIMAETDKVMLGMHAMLGAVIKSVFSRGLGYFELNPAGSEFIETLAVANNAPFGIAHVNSDVFDDSESSKVEKAAKESGYAGVVMRLNPKNIDKISEWTKTFETRGFSLAPVSAVSASHMDESSPDTAGHAAPPADHAAEEKQSPASHPQEHHE